MVTDAAMLPPRYTARFADVSIAICEPGSGTSAVAMPAHRFVLWQGSEFFRAKLDNWATAAAVGDDEESSPARAAATGAAAAVSQRQQDLPEIILTVPPGQTCMGQLLVRCLYAAPCELPGMLRRLVPQQERLLQLLLLADAYTAGAIAAAAAASLGSILPGELDWPVVLQMQMLPRTLQQTLCQLPGYRVAAAAAASKLRLLLGNLDRAWQHEELAACLEQLPAELLVQVLQDPDTRAASEDTVVYTIDRWLLHQPPGTVDELQLQQLVDSIRLPHCSQLSLATALPALRWLRRHVAAAELPAAMALAALPSVGPVARALRSQQQLLLRRPAWLLPARPRSMVRCLNLDWELSLPQLRQLVLRGLQQQHCAAGAAAGAGACAAGGVGVTTTTSGGLVSHVCVWSGHSFALKLALGDDCRLSLSLLMLPSLSDTAALGWDDASATGQLTQQQQEEAVASARNSSGSSGSSSSGSGGCSSRPEQQEQQDQEQQELAAVLCSLCAVRHSDGLEVCAKQDKIRTFVAGGGHRWPDFFRLGRVHSLDGLLSGLARQHGLEVTAAAGLRLRATISKVL